MWIIRVGPTYSKESYKTEMGVRGRCDYEGGQRRDVRTQLTIADLEDVFGGGGMSQGMPLEARTGKAINSPLETTDWNAVLLTS